MTVSGSHGTAKGIGRKLNYNYRSQLNVGNPSNKISEFEEGNNKLAM